jgi:hypothetical protein
VRQPRGIPADLDDRTAAQVAGTLLVVRIVRGALLTLFLLAAAVGVEARGWPHPVTAVVALAAVLLAARVARDVRRLGATRRRRDLSAPGGRRRPASP